VLGPLLFRLEGPYFAIGSWVAAEALRLICAQFKTLGGGTGMSISPSDLSQMMGLKSVQALFGLRPAAARDVLIYWIALLLAVMVTLGITAFVRSRMGLALAASRDNAAAARSVGVRTTASDTSFGSLSRSRQAWSARWFTCRRRGFHRMLLLASPTGPPTSSLS
jgi:branched-chain amino acid transport system permease protein